MNEQNNIIDSDSKHLISDLTTTVYELCNKNIGTTTEFMTALINNQNNEFQKIAEIFNKIIKTTMKHFFS